MRPLQLVTFSLVLINEALCTTVMFPFVGKFITVLDSSVTASSAGYYSGILLGAYQGAMTIFCSHWGHVSDIIGRKPVFLIGFCSGAFCMFMVGMSESLWMAIVFRVLHGMCAANAPLAKTYAAEVTDKENLARVFGLLSVTWALGAFLGPMIGGFLYDPATSPVFSQVPFFSAPGSLFATHPALLPCTVVSLYTLVAAVLTALFLPESNIRAIGLRRWLVERFFSKKRQYGLANTTGDDVSQMISRTADAGDVEANAQPDGGIVAQEELSPVNDDTEDMGLRNTSVVSVDLEYTSAPPCVHHTYDDGEEHKQHDVQAGEDAGRTTPAGSDTEGAHSTPPRAEFTWGDLFRHPVLRRCVPMYMALCAYNIIYTEVLPLYGIALQQDGGLEITTTEIGIVFTANAAISVVMNLIFPHVTKRYETLFLWKICNVVFAATVMLNGVATSLNRFESKAVTIGWLVFLAVFRCTASTWCFSLCMMFVANAAPPEYLGKITGINHACGSLMRSLWPLLAAPMFAWSISAPHWFPFNHYLVFVISTLLAVFAYYISLPLREDEVIKKTKPTVDLDAEDDA